jgi:hypothetical protein
VDRPALHLYPLRSDIDAGVAVAIEVHESSLVEMLLEILFFGQQ